MIEHEGKKYPLLKYIAAYIKNMFNVHYWGMVIYNLIPKKVRKYIIATIVVELYHQNKIAVNDRNLLNQMIDQVGGERVAGVKKIPFSYDSKFTPEGYRCSECGKQGVKLWRDIVIYAQVELKCADCCCREERINCVVDAEGYRKDESGHKTDQFYRRLPAVPTVENDTYWGYTSVPPDGVKWWRSLPTY